MTLDKELLTAKGTIDALTALTAEGPWTVNELADEMDVANTTARNRVGQLRDAGLVEEDADLRDGRAVRVFELTETGEQDADALFTLLGTDEEGEPTGADPDGSVDVATDEDETVEE